MESPEYQGVGAVDFQWTTEVQGVQGGLVLHPELDWSTPAVAPYAASQAGPVLRIPSGKLLTGKRYTFILTATPKADAALKVSAAVEVTAALSAITVAVRGGSRVTSVAAAATFEAAAVDPSTSTQANGLPRAFVYTWSVEPLSPGSTVSTVSERRSSHGPNLCGTGSFQMFCVVSWLLENWCRFCPPASLLPDVRNGPTSGPLLGETASFLICPETSCMGSCMTWQCIFIGV